MAVVTTGGARYGPQRVRFPTSVVVYSAAVLADSPVGYWHLDEPSGTTAIDSSGNGFNGTYNNAPTLNVAPLINTGKAVTFPGVNQVCQVVQHAAFNANNRVSIEAWVLTSQSGATNPQIVCSDDSSAERYFQFRLSATGKLDVIFLDTGASAHTKTGAVTINDGLRHHVVGTYDGAAVHAYVDGVEDGTGTAGAFTLATSNPGIQFAERHNSGGDGSFLNGTLDEIAVYTSALSAARVAAHYAAGIA